MDRGRFAGRRPLVTWTTVAGLTLALVLSACGASSSTGGDETGAGSTATPTIPPTATNQPFATQSAAAVSAQSIETAGCPPLQTTAGTAVSFVAAGALRVSTPARELDYPSELLPSNVPSAPYQISASAVNTFAPSPPVNPSLSPGYFFEVCNQTGVAHALTSVGVSIASFSPSSGAVNVWHLCDNGVYDAATKHGLGGCGGGSAGTELIATLGGDSTGASAPVSGLIWPATIDSNKSIVFLIAVNGLTSQGTYALNFGFGVDGSAPTRLTPSDGFFVIAPTAKVWTGTACQTPAMLAQIPAATQDTYYVCPPAS